MSKLRKRSFNSTSGDLSASVLSTTMPGRIYAKARTSAQVTKLAMSLAELGPPKLSPVPPEDVLQIFKVSHSYGNWPWARVQGSERKWNQYEGDTGLITEIQGLSRKFLALIPRLQFHQVGEGPSRPPQALLSRWDANIRTAAKDEANGTFTWKGQIFSAEGALLVALDSIKLLPLPEPFPSHHELSLFRSIPVLSAIDAEKTTQKMAQARMKIGDRVKVISGPYFHLIGEVKETRANEVSIYLPSQDIVQDMQIDTVRAAFLVGDHVRILDGAKQGSLGWVVEVLEDALRVLHVEFATEVSNGDL